MASVIKKCGCPEGQWRRCKHNWTVRFRDEQGRQRERSFLHDQKSLASALATKAEHARKAGEPVHPARCPFTFGEYAERVIRQHPIAQRTQDAYRVALRHQLGSLAGRNLADVAGDRAGVTELLLLTLPGQGYKRGTISFAQALVTLVMNTAVANGDIDSHRLARIRLPRPSEEDSIDIALIERLCEDRGLVETLAGALPPRLALAVWLSYGCGLRISEALAVRVSDFSEEYRVLTVSRQVSNGSKTVPLKARDAGRGRIVPVPSWTAQRVREHVQAFGITDYLFPGQRGRFTTRFTLSTPWQKARAEAGLPGLRYHDLRHAWCSRLISEGITSAEVAKMAGHRDSGVTERIYFHFLPQAFDRAREVLDRWE